MSKIVTPMNNKVAAISKMMELPGDKKKKDTNSSDKHIELVHFDYDLTFRMCSTYIFKSNR